MGLSESGQTVEQQILLVAADGIRIGREFLCVAAADSKIILHYYAPIARKMRQIKAVKGASAQQISDPRALVARHYQLLAHA